MDSVVLLFGVACLALGCALVNLGVQMYRGYTLWQRCLRSERDASENRQRKEAERDARDEAERVLHVSRRINIVDADGQYVASGTQPWEREYAERLIAIDRERQRG